MTIIGFQQITLFAVILFALAYPLGSYLAKVFQGQNTFLSPLIQPIEILFLKILGLQRDHEQYWSQYCLSLLWFNLWGILFLYALFRLQIYFPLNPESMTALPPDLALNSAISFATNTNWQNYAGENTLSYFTQMMGLTVHNFTSAATGFTTAIALIRGFTRKTSKTIGAFYVDLIRSILYVLLPLSIVLALIFVWQGVPQNFDSYVHSVTLEGLEQVIPQGPVASQEAIKLLGTNGGGFFNANSSHPYENPTGLSNLLQMTGLLLLSVSLVFAFGHMIQDKRQSRALIIAMGSLLFLGIILIYWAESHQIPPLNEIEQDISPSLLSLHGNMEGKEVRFGIVNSAIFNAITTATSCGAVNAMLDSFMPLGGMIALINMMLGEVIFGGVGVGLHGAIIFAILTVFIAGLMVGRTPEYLGKKIEAKDIKLSMLALLVFPFSVLGLGGLSIIVPQGLSAVASHSPHSLTQILYAYTSVSANNGSAFAGFSGNSFYHNSMMSLAMILGRYWVIIPTLALAGSLAAKRTIPLSSGTFPTHGLMFIGLFIAIIAIVGGLTFFPFLVLGPVLDHLTMLNGPLF